MLRLVAVNALLATAYVAMGLLGLLLAQPEHASATIVWAPSGISIGGLLLAGARAWPGVFAGAFATNVIHASLSLSRLSPVNVVLTSLGIGVGNTVEAVLAAALVLRFAHGREVFLRSGNVLLFGLFVAASATVSATIGVTSLRAAGVVEWAHFGSAWVTWSLGDAVGAILIAPPLVLFCGSRLEAPSSTKFVEAAVILLIMGSVAYTVFSGWVPFAYLAIPVLVWTAFRFGPKETSLAILVLSAFAVWGTVSGTGPFIRSSMHESLLFVQAFMGTIALTTLCMAALVAERRSALQIFRDSQSLLERRVQQRGQDLSQMVQALGDEVSERRRAEEVLQASEQRLRLLIEQAYDAVIVIDSDGTIVEWNPQAEATFGWSRKEALGRELAETLIPPSYREAHRKGLQHFKLTGEGPVLNQRLQLAALHRKGHELPVELTITAIRSQTGYLFAAFVRDISGRLEMEEKLRQAERLAAIGEMVTGLAHESRNVLQRIQACLDLLSFKVQGKPDQLELVEDIQKAQDRLHHLYQEVRDYAAPIKLEPQDVDVHELLGETWYELAPMREGRVTRLEHVYLPPLSSPPRQETDELPAHRGGPVVSAGDQRRAAQLYLPAEDRDAERDFICKVDRLGIGQVFRNILENALSAASDPVIIEVTWSETRYRSRPALQIALRDNGPGLSPEARQKIFDPFFTTKVKGTGLGMAIAKRIVEANEGQIFVGANSKPGAEIVVVLLRKT